MIPGVRRLARSGTAETGLGGETGLDDVTADDAVVDDAAADEVAEEDTPSEAEAAPGKSRLVMFLQGAIVFAVMFVALRWLFSRAFGEE